MSEISTITLSSSCKSPILGQFLDNVHVLRLDLMGGEAPGNKVFKLRANLEKARRENVLRIVSFGGAWSNHLHALAAVGAELGLETIAIVRGGEQETAMLRDLRCQGMKLIMVSRQEYRRRDELDYQRAIQERYSPCLIVPEGGANPEGVQGCLAIADLINQQGKHWRRVILPVGTGTTFAGIAAGLACADELVGISALKGAFGLNDRITQALSMSKLKAQLPWKVLHDHHCGGFARSNDSLRTFMLEFERIHKLHLEPVYTGKMLLAVHSLIASGQWSATEPVLAIHTGGLQGRRGYSWLD